jgi:hypothetical protein
MQPTDITALPARKKLRYYSCVPHSLANISVVQLRFHVKIKRTAKVKQQMAVALIAFC